MNPLLAPFETPFFIPPFDLIKEHHYLPAIEENIEKAKKEIDLIVTTNAAPSFENTIVALEKSGRLLSQAASVLFNLNSAETNETIQEATMKASPLLAAFNNEIKQNEQLFGRVKEVYEQRSSLPLSQEEFTLLEKTYKSFIRSGAALDAVAKTRFAELSQELAQLTVKFNENVLAETNAFELVLENEEDLAGLPDYVVEAAAVQAKNKGYDGKWVFNLQGPSLCPLHAIQRST